MTQDGLTVVLSRGSITVVHLVILVAAAVLPRMVLWSSMGYWGSATTQKLQETLGLTADGLVPGQPESWKKQNPGLTTGWQWVSDSQAMGADVISKLQAKVGAAADGLIGPGTITAIQAHFGTTQDGVLSEQSSSIMALQKALNEGKF